MREYRDLSEMYRDLVPEYKSRSYRPLNLTVATVDLTACRRLGAINPDRMEKRWRSYVSPDELKRVRLKAGDFSLRFGVLKEGQGYHGPRGDFCLVGGAWHSSTLTMFYRSLELIGGLCYDLAVAERLADKIGTELKTLVIYACRANVFALKRNSNEKLYPRMKEILG